jgi:hypothetical protein
MPHQEKPEILYKPSFLRVHTTGEYKRNNFWSFQQYISEKSLSRSTDPHNKTSMPIVILHPQTPRKNENETTTKRRLLRLVIPKPLLTQNFENSLQAHKHRIDQPLCLAIAPELAVRKFKFIDRRVVNRDRVSGFKGCDIESIRHPRRVVKVFCILGGDSEHSTVKMVDVFKKRKLLGDENVIDSTQMLSILGKTDTARVGNDRNPKSI